jgi:Cu-Zn family superoxide dismutase
MSATGKDVGFIELTQTRAGVRLQLALKDLPPGEHGFHVHAVGTCEASFASAGGHFNPEGRQHGFLTEHGHHAGDMPNIVIPRSGMLMQVILNSEITLERGQPHSLFHPGGTSIVIHADKDDHVTDPAGNAGDRIACGVVTEPPAPTAVSSLN